VGPPTYSLEQPSLEAAEADLVRLWDHNLALHGDAARKYVWTCREAPAPPLAELLLRAEGVAVGCIGVMPRSFSVGGQDVRAGLLGDLAVDAAHRSVLPALTLVRGARKVALEHGALSYGLPNPAAAPVLRRCGYREIGQLTRYACVLRHAAFVRRKVELPGVPEAAGVFLDAAGFARMLPYAARALGAFRLDWLDDTDRRFDRLWNAARTDYDVVGERSAAMISWRFLHHPSERCQLAALVAREHPHELFAYAVVDRDGGLARIRDLFGHAGSLGPLLDLLLPALLVRGASSVSMRYFGHPRLVSLLLARRFVARESRWPVLVALSGDGTLHNGTLEAARWHLTDEDEDI
jgi:hypothetical protein